MRALGCAVVMLVGGCSLYFGEPPSRPPPGDDPQPPAPPPIVGETPAAYVTVARGPRDVMDIAIDDAYVYWLVNHQDINQAEVFRIAKLGGPTEHIAHVDGRVYAFALDDTYLYLPVYDQSATGGPFLRVRKTGGTPEVLEDHLRYLDFVSVHDGGVYIAPLVDESTIDYQLWHYPAGGGAHELLVDGLRGPEALAFDASDLYVTTAGDSHFQEAPAGGGAIAQPIPSLDALHALSDGTRVYFMSGAVGECPNARISAYQRGSTELTDFGALGSCASDLALTARGVLAADAFTHAVYDFSLDGSGRQTLATGLAAPMAIAAEPDGSTIYWGDFATGDIDRLDR
jgi:hypothetical protein